MMIKYKKLLIYNYFNIRINLKLTIRNQKFYNKEDSKISKGGNNEKNTDK